jgi:hypothetical protein
MNEGVMALTVAILAPQLLSPEQCFERLFTSNRVMKRQKVSDDIVEDMARMKKTMTYKQIGEVYGLNADAVYTRIRRSQGRC